jgi:hypothetical protein
VSSTTTSSHDMLGFALMVDFLVNNHIVGPESEAASISESIINILAAQDNCDQLMIVFLVFE